MIYIPMNKAEWAYESMACFVKEWYRMPGVEDAFSEGEYCMIRYHEAMDAYARLRERLGVVDEDEDVEIMISAFEDIQQKLCLRMYHYGARFGE